MEKDAAGEALLPAAVRDRMRALHEQMQPVLQVFVQQARIDPGRYIGNGYGHWERRQDPGRVYFEAVTIGSTGRGTRFFTGGIDRR